MKHKTPVAVLQMQDVWNSKLDTTKVRTKQYPLFFRIFAEIISEIMNKPIYNIFVYFTTVYSSSSNILFTSPWLKQLVCSKSVSLISSLNLLHACFKKHTQCLHFLQDGSLPDAFVLGISDLWNSRQISILDICHMQYTECFCSLWIQCF